MDVDEPGADVGDPSLKMNKDLQKLYAAGPEGGRERQRRFRRWGGEAGVRAAARRRRRRAARARGGG